MGAHTLHPAIVEPPPPPCVTAQLPSFPGWLSPLAKSLSYAAAAAAASGAGGDGGAARGGVASHVRPVFFGRDHCVSAVEDADMVSRGISRGGGQGLSPARFPRRACCFAVGRRILAGAGPQGPAHRTHPHGTRRTRGGR